MKNVILFLMMAGSSTRTELENEKKQFYRDKTNNLPMFLYPLKQALLTEKFTHIYLVIAQEDEEKVTKILNEFNILDNRINLVFGGQTRAESVKNAIDSTLLIENLDKNQTKIIIHDACRSLVTMSDFDKIIDELDFKIAVTYATEIVDTIILQNPSIKLCDRTNYLSVQTPQGFHLDILTEVYEDLESLTNTDEMQLIFQKTRKFNTIKGDLHLFKVTTKTDLEIYERLIKTTRKKENKK